MIVAPMSRSDVMKRSVLALVSLPLLMISVARADDAPTAVETCPKKLGVIAVAEPQTG